MGYAEDVRDPRAREIEDLVFAVLRNQWRDAYVEDRRAERTYFDGILHRLRVPPRKFDVKCDGWVHLTRRLPYEIEHVYPSGLSRPGWAVTAHDLDVILYVCRYELRCWWVHLPRLRLYVQERTAGGATLPHGWKRIENAARNRDRGYTTCGFAVPIADLLDEGDGERGIIQCRWQLAGRLARRLPVPARGSLVP